MITFVSGYFIEWKVSKHRVFPGTYFPLFGLNTGKYGPEKALYLNTFQAADSVH